MLSNTKAAKAARIAAKAADAELAAMRANADANADVTAQAQADVAAILADVPAPTDAPAAPASAPAPTLSPRQAAKAAHDAAGFFGRVYTGISKTRNADVSAAPVLGTSKATARTFANLTERMHATLHDLATRYGIEQFPIIGIDRGQAAIFLNSGMLIQLSDNRAILSNCVCARYIKRGK